MLALYWHHYLICCNVCAQIFFFKVLTLLFRSLFDFSSKPAYVSGIAPTDFIATVLSTYRASRRKLLWIFGTWPVVMAIPFTFLTHS